MRRILYVTYGDPEDTSSGNAQRTHLIYEALKKIGRVYTIQLVESDAGRVRDDFCRCILTPPHGWRQRVNQLVHHLLLWPTRGLVQGYYPFSFQLDVGGCFPGIEFDLVVKRYLGHLGVAHLWDIAPLYVDIDDHPKEVYETFVMPRIGWRRGYVSLLRRLYQWLIERHVTGGWVANASQAEWSHFKTPVLHLPNLPQLPSDKYCPEASREGYVFSIGLMAYQANYEGVDRFVTEIWPQVRQEFPALQYFICGKGAPSALCQKWADVSGVKVLGFVDDLELLYAHALATVVPIDQGGGTCLKTLESMAHARVCLSTPFGARGLPENDVQNGKCGIAVYGTAEEFVAQLRHAVFDARERHSLEIAGEQYVRAHYSKEEFEKAVERRCGCPIKT